MDTLNLCRSSTSMHVDPQRPRSLRSRRPVSLDIDTYIGLRRTHSNPENCQSDLDECMITAKNPVSALNQIGSLLDTENDTTSPYSTLKSNAESVRKVGGNLNDNGIAQTGAHGDTLKGKGTREFGSSGKKGITISEENLVSRVSRWLSTMEQPEIRDPDTF